MMPSLASSSSATTQDGAPRTRPWTEVSTVSVISVLDFIPKQLHAAIASETCRADLASYINAAIRAVLAFPGGGTLFFPRGAYLVSEIDATNADPAQFAKSLRIVGEGRYVTSIRPAVADAVLLNAAGRNNMAVQSIQFHSVEHSSQVAIYLCRTSQSPNSNGNRFFDILVSGNYAVAGVVSIAAESTSWIACRFENTNLSARHCCFATSHRPEAIPVRSRLAFRPQASSNSDNVMIDCEFHAPYPGTAPVLFAGAAAYAMQSCTVIAGEVSGARLVTYRPDSGVFSGPVTWTAPHFEVFGRGNVVHFLDAPDEVSYFQSIHSFGGNYVVGSETALMSYDRVAAKQPVLMASTWTVAALPWATREVRFVVFGLSESVIDFRMGDGVGTVTIPGYAADSRITAARRDIAQTVSTPDSD